MQARSLKGWRVLILLTVVGFVPLCRAQSGSPELVSPDEKASRRAKRTNEKDAVTKRLPKTASPQPQYAGDPPDNRLGLSLLKNIGRDQKAIWTSPGRVRFADATWLVPLGGLTAGLLATDRDVSKHLSDSPNRLHRSRQLSNYGVASLVGTAGGMYLWGAVTKDEHKRETGLLAGEALINVLAVNTAIQFSTGRERPSADNGQGRFLSGGRSFPSNHAAAAWAVAGVIAHEYPGPLTKLFAYGLASAVSAARITGKEHFPSDVLVGSAIGWFVGQHVYRSHHDPTLGGGEWDSFLGSRHGESERDPRNMGSPYVPLDSWIYPAIERLVAMGYVQTAFLGMRPWTRLECARLVDEAGDQLHAEAEESPEAARLYQALEREFADEFEALGGGSNRRFELESVYTRFTGISGKPLTDGYHFGQTIINDFGRPYQEGFNNVTGFSAWASEGPFIAYVRGEYQHAPSAPALPGATRQTIASVDFLPAPPPATPFSAVNEFRLLDAYVAMNLENWQVSFGKQSLWWGPGLGGPMMFSDNAEPVNMFRINRVSPFKLPSILGWLGPMRTEFFVGQLSGHHFVNGPSGITGDFATTFDPQPFIHGQKLSFKPTPNFEFSVSRTTIFAGSGVPFNSRTFLKSLFSGSNGPPGSSSDPGDRRSGVDFMYRVPKLRNWLTFYGEAFAEDEFSPLGYPRKTVVQGGIYLARVPGIPKLDFRAEGGSTEPPDFPDCNGCFYSNGRYLNGYTNRSQLMGTWIGRAAQGEQIWSNYWFSPLNKIGIRLRHRKISGQFIPQGGTVNDGAVNADFWIRSSFSVSTSVQYERWQIPVLAPGSQSNVTATFQLTFHPRWAIH